MYTVQHVKYSQKNPILISGSEIGTIVKHYLKKDFETFKDFKTVMTRKFALTPDERKSFDEASNKGKQYLFNRGNKFEANTIQSLRDSYQSEYEIINFNDFVQDDEKMILASDELGICAVPDVLLMGKDKNILCEIKSSECGGKSTQNYKYQLVAESLLVEGFYNIKTINKLFFEYPSKENGKSSITITNEETEALANDIKKAIEMLKEDMQNGNIDYLTFEEMMKPFQETETIEIVDQEILDIAIRIKESDMQYQDYLHSQEELKRTLKEKFGNQSINILLTEESGMKYLVKHTCSMQSYHTEASKREAIAKAQKALQEAENIKIGSIKSQSRFGVKVELV